MAGYMGYSKSNNAIEAEEQGKFSASILAKKLKVKTEAIKKYMVPCEWHHTSSHYNQTDYYDADLLLKIANKEDVQGIYDEEEVQEAKELLEKMKNFKKVVVEREYIADIEYLEWSGSRNHPHATEIKYKAVKVLEKGCFYYFHIDGKIVKKKIGSNGTYVNKIKI